MKVLALAGTLATTRRRIARDRQEVMSFMRAFVEAIHFFKTNREASIRIMQKFMAGLPREIVEPALRRNQRFFADLAATDERSDSGGLGS